MSDLRELGKQVAANVGAVPDTCGVKGCSISEAELVELDPLDPLDHSSTLIQLCPEHQMWAEDRNALAKDVYADFVEFRRELGDKYSERIESLGTPPSGSLPERGLGETSDSQSDTEDSA